MIRLLSGTIYQTHDDSITLENAGVGYRVFTPQPAQFTRGRDVTVHVHHAIRDTASDLYGFATEQERDLFEQLLRVPKIGPKSALQTLTQATPLLIIEAITRNDAAYLQKLSSIGKKTCENIVQQLHDKLPPALEVAVSGSTSDALTGVQADAIDALIALGYEPSAARNAIQSLPDQTNDTTVNQLVTHALKAI